jgi:prepilin signal peptidase PulO-like enzyme (type II secretory pathway)
MASTCTRRKQSSTPYVGFGIGGIGALTLRAGAGVGERLDRGQIWIAGSARVALVTASARGGARGDRAPGQRPPADLATAAPLTAVPASSYKWKLLNNWLKEGFGLARGRLPRGSCLVCADPITSLTGMPLLKVLAHRLRGVIFREKRSISRRLSIVAQYI